MTRPRPNPLWYLAAPAANAAMKAISPIAISATKRPYPREFKLKPYVAGRRFGWTHYGVMIPDLPEPFRYFSTMIIVGFPGATAIDIDEAVIRSPRDMATVSVSTAAPDSNLYRAYSVADSCDFAEDGSSLKFGDELTISGSFPEFKIVASSSGISAELTLRATGQTAWFAKTPAYRHLSLCVEYSGWITSGDEQVEVSGVGTFEYAACAGLHGLVDRQLSASTKVPLDFFTYHVVAMDDRNQLLLVDVHVIGKPLATMAYVREAGGDTWVTHKDVQFEVTEYAAEPTIDPFGNAMRLPVSFRWTAGADLTVTGTVDSPPRFGVGRGYIIGYQAQGTVHGRAFEGRAYMEYIDTEAVNRAAPGFTP